MKAYFLVLIILSLLLAEAADLKSLDDQKESSHLDQLSTPQHNNNE